MGKEVGPQPDQATVEILAGRLEALPSGNRFELRSGSSGPSQGLALQRFLSTAMLTHSALKAPAVGQDMSSVTSLVLPCPGFLGLLVEEMGGLIERRVVHILG